MALDIPLIVFTVGLTIASALAVQARSKEGEDGTRTMLDSGLVFSIVGLISSGWTYAIHNSILDSGETTMCASKGLVQCGSVIGDPDWNNLFGIPWGITGLLSFSLLFFLFLSRRMDMHAKWAESFTTYSLLAGLAGLPFVVFLVFVELTQVEGAPHICPFCTVAHLSLIGFLIVAYVVRERKQSGMWA
jgi:uncharacterized membrane protein